MSVFERRLGELDEQRRADEATVVAAAESELKKKEEHRRLAAEALPETLEAVQALQALGDASIRAIDSGAVCTRGTGGTENIWVNWADRKGEPLHKPISAVSASRRELRRWTQRRAVGWTVSCHEGPSSSLVRIPLQGQATVVQRKEGSALMEGISLEAFADLGYRTWLETDEKGHADVRKTEEEWAEATFENLVSTIAKHVRSVGSH